MNMTKFLLAAALALGFSGAYAGGTITHLSGKVSVLKVNGQTEVAKAGSTVNTGETLITGADGFVRMEMTDTGEMVLRPNSNLKIENYAFNEAKPKEDSFVFKMVKGGLRTVSGLVGKRGDKDAYQGKTDTATIGIRGTQFDLRVCAGDCGAIPNGTYVAVKFGAVAAANPQGSIDIQAGKVGVVQSNAPPTILPRDPGIGFTPPATIPKLDEKKKIEKQKEADEKAAVEKEKEKAKEEKADDKKDAKKDEKKDDKKDEKKDDKKDEKKSDAKKDDKADSKSDKKSDAKADSKSDAKSDGKSDGKSDAKTEAKTESKPAPAASTQTAASSGGGGGAECTVE